MAQASPKLFISDALAPFFLPRCFLGQRVLNWSKVPFALLEANGIISESDCDSIVKRFAVYAAKIARLGFTTLSLDDLVHMVIPPGMQSEWQHRRYRYSLLYSRIIEAASQAGLGIVVNTDAGFSQHHMHGTKEESIRLLYDSCQQLFSIYPRVQGVVLRIGECDGVDVTSSNRSTLLLQTPEFANHVLLKLLPLFERSKRILIVRTWTVGAHPIGDLIWNPKTYATVFNGLTSRNLIVSHKYGDTDFFRYLKLNPLIFEGTQQKIVEFQTRREYEGFGEFPSFIGYEYEKYRDRLMEMKNFIGIHVWCQTGGWSHFKKLSFVGSLSLWNEVNTAVTLSLFKGPKTSRQAIHEWAAQTWPPLDPILLEKVLRLSDIVMRYGWYIPEFSQKSLYFKRTRLPPLVWVFWDTILVSPLIRLLVNSYVKDSQLAIEQGYKALMLVTRMQQLAQRMGMPDHAFVFEYRTLELIVMNREYMLSKDPALVAEKMHQAIILYRQDFHDGFVIDYNGAKRAKSHRFIAMVFEYVFRDSAEYRVILDKVVMPFMLLLFSGIVKKMSTKRLPRIARERAMGIDSLLK